MVAVAVQLLVAVVQLLVVDHRHVAVVVTAVVVRPAVVAKAAAVDRPATAVARSSAYLVAEIESLRLSH